MPISVSEHPIGNAICFCSDVPFFPLPSSPTHPVCWPGSRISPVVMHLPYCTMCVYSACVCVCMLCKGVLQKTWNYCKYVTLLNKCMREWLDEWNSNSERMYTEARDFPFLFEWGGIWKVEKNVLYNIQEFQTWSNDLKRRRPTGLRDLPCFPYLPLPSSQCPEKHLNSHPLWKRVDRTTLAPASCA